MTRKDLIRILIIVWLILLIPFIAMQLEGDVDWNLMDFTIASIILFCLGIALTLTFNKLKGKKFAPFIIVAIILLFFAIWAELGVGLFGSPLSGN